MVYDILHNTPIITEYMYKAFDMALFAVLHALYCTFFIHCSDKL